MHDQYFGQIKEVRREQKLRLVLKLRSDKRQKVLQIKEVRNEQNQACFQKGNLKRQTKSLNSCNQM